MAAQRRVRVRIFPLNGACQEHGIITDIASMQYISKSGDPLFPATPSNPRTRLSRAAKEAGFTRHEASMCDVRYQIRHHNHWNWCQRARDFFRHDWVRKTHTLYLCSNTSRSALAWGSTTINGNMMDT